MKPYISCVVHVKCLICESCKEGSRHPIGFPPDLCYSNKAGSRMAGAWVRRTSADKSDEKQK